MNRSVFLVSLLALVGCTPPPRSVAEFKAHPAADREVLAACAQGVHQGVDCANAQTAAEQIKSDQRLTRYKQSF
jgi:hypothetical protein